MIAETDYSCPLVQRFLLTHFLRLIFTEPIEHYCEDYCYCCI